MKWVRRASGPGAGLVARLDRVLPAALGRVLARAGSGGPVPRPADGARPLVLTGALAAAAAAGTGLAILTLLAAIGWVAAPHAGSGLTAVLRAAGAIWLVGHHVGFTLRGAGRIGLLPLGLVLLPGALLWRAGRWVVSSGGVLRLRHVGYAAVALAVPYALIAGALALAATSSLAAPSPEQAVVALATETPESILGFRNPRDLPRALGLRQVWNRPAGPGPISDLSRPQLVRGARRGFSASERTFATRVRSARQNCTSGVYHVAGCGREGARPPRRRSS